MYRNISEIERAQEKCSLKLGHWSFARCGKLYSIVSDDEWHIKKQANCFFEILLNCY